MEEMGIAGMSQDRGAARRASRVPNPVSKWNKRAGLVSLALSLPGMALSLVWLLEVYILRVPSSSSASASPALGYLILMAVTVLPFLGFWVGVSSLRPPTAKMGLACSVINYGVIALMFCTWPLCSVDRITRITEIKFPATTRLLEGYDDFFVSEITVAKLQMPRSDVHAFLSQPQMSLEMATRISDWQYGSFTRHGWSVKGIRHFRVASFANGSSTYLIIDLDDPRRATVYIYYDEP